MDHGTYTREDRNFWLNMNRLELLEKLRDAAGKLQRLSKEITSSAVPGLLLVREDLGIRRKPMSIVHGQKHKQTRNNNPITMPSDGQGQFPEGISAERPN